MHMMPLQNLTRAFERLCFLPPPDYWLDFVIVFLVVVILSSIVGSLLHRFRWHVRYWRFVYEVRIIFAINNIISIIIHTARKARKS